MEESIIKTKKSGIDMDKFHKILDKFHLFLENK